MSNRPLIQPLNRPLFQPLSVAPTSNRPSIQPSSTVPILIQSSPRQLTQEQKPTTKQASQN